MERGEKKEGKEEERRERRGGWGGGKKKEKEGREWKKESVCVNCSKDEIAGNVRHSLVCSHYLYFTIMSTAK